MNVAGATEAAVAMRLYYWPGAMNGFIHSLAAGDHISVYITRRAPQQSIGNLLEAPHQQHKTFIQVEEPTPITTGAFLVTPNLD